ncbi:MAG: HAD domain-containing protein [Candidatus Gastranaerophilaceae bacterium]
MKRTNKYLFLDIDGVMNSVKDNDLETDICERNILLLKQIIDKTNCTIIITSALRNSSIPKMKEKYNAILRKLYSYGIEVYDKTPSISKGNRGDEIKKWLSMFNTEPIEKLTFAVLDDEKVPDMENHLVKTDYWYGLQQEHVDRIIKILNANK